MALALYDSARFDRSPASTFSTSHQTLPTDLSLMSIQNQVSVLDLRGAMRRKSDRHRACFVSVLDRCYSRIRRCASVLRDECTFEVPLFVPGLPVYNVEKCVRFVASHLAKNGFRVERLPAESDEKEEGRMLVISWSTNDPSEDPPPPPLAYRPMPKIAPPPPPDLQPAWNPQQAGAGRQAVAGRQEPQPAYGSAFAPLISPERLRRPASDYSPPPPQYAASLSPPLAVGTRIQATPISTNRAGVSGVSNVSVSNVSGVSNVSKATGDWEREKVISQTENQRGSRSINEFKPSRKFALK